MTSVSLKNYQFIKKIKKLPFVQGIYLFGSRARGDHRTHSDIDLAIVCPSATPKQWNQILDLIEKADTLFQIDCVRYDTIKDKHFRKKINQDKLILYQKAQMEQETKMKKPFVAILIGSDSDFPILQEALAVLKALQVSYEIKITSAHRTPEETQTYVHDAEARGCAVFIAAAGLAAHLAGAVAALTLKPVIGVPLDGGGLGGLDALLSTVQMPGGIPVGCMALGKTGAKNAAYFAAEIFALADEALHQRLITERQKNKEAILAKDQALQARLKP